MDYSKHPRPLFWSIAAVAVVTSSLPAQQPARSGSEEVLMLEEIRIEVQPERPTVVITIPRQRPSIKPVALSKDIETLAQGEAHRVKPRLSDLTPAQVEDEQKMLAKERTP